MRSIECKCDVDVWKISQSTNLDCVTGRNYTGIHGLISVNTCSIDTKELQKIEFNFRNYKQFEIWDRVEFYG